MITAEEARTQVRELFLADLASTIDRLDSLVKNYIDLREIDITEDWLLLDDKHQVILGDYLKDLGYSILYAGWKVFLKW